jgi:hypothetical protein
MTEMMQKEPLTGRDPDSGSFWFGTWEEGDLV